MKKSEVVLFLLNLNLWYTFSNRLKCKMYMFIINNIVKIVSIHAICADAPAKSFIMKVQGHNGYYSWTRYVIEGEHANSTYFSFADIYCRDRTHEGYVNRIKEENHVSDSLSDSIRISGFDVVKCFPLDHTHLVVLGVMRKVIHLWLHKGSLIVRIPSWKVKKNYRKFTIFKIISYKWFCSQTKTHSRNWFEESYRA